MGVSGCFASSVGGISWVGLLENNSGFGVSVSCSFEIPPESSSVASWCFFVSGEPGGKFGSSLIVGVPVAPRWVRSSELVVESWALVMSVWFGYSFVW